MEASRYTLNDGSHQTHRSKQQKKKRIRSRTQDTACQQLVIHACPAACVVGLTELLSQQQLFYGRAQVVWLESTTFTLARESRTLHDKDKGTVSREKKGQNDQKVLTLSHQRTALL